MKYDFDKIIDRRDTDSIKWDFAVEFGLPADVLPLWVADMDIPTAPAVTEALVQRARHGIFGYSDVKGILRGRPRLVLFPPRARGEERMAREDLRRRLRPV